MTRTATEDGIQAFDKRTTLCIEALLQTPMSLREIGEVIGVSKGTVSREIRRNCDMRGHRRYRWQLAQKKYERRMKGEEIEWKLNNRPRKSLGYLTLIEYCKKMFNFDFGVRCTSK